MALKSINELKSEDERLPVRFGITGMWNMTDLYYWGAQLPNKQYTMFVYNKKENKWEKDGLYVDPNFKIFIPEPNHNISDILFRKKI